MTSLRNFLIFSLCSGIVLYFYGSVQTATAQTAEIEQKFTINNGTPVGPVNRMVIGTGISRYATWLDNPLFRQRLADAKFGALRFGLDTCLEHSTDPYPRPGQWQWDGLDRLFKLAFDTGAQPVFLVCSSPKGIAHRLNDKGEVESADWAEYGRFMAGVVKHYNQDEALGKGNKVIYWEMWNEPSTQGLPDGKIVSWDVYKDFVHTVGGAMKAVDPSIKLCGPIWSSSDLTQEGWISKCAKELPELDLLGWHDYGPQPVSNDSDRLAWPVEHYEINPQLVKSGGPHGEFTAPDGKHFGVDLSEYNMSWANGGDEYNKKYHSAFNAVYCASSMIHALRGGTDIFCQFASCESGLNLLGLFGNDSAFTPYLPYDTYSLFGNHIGDAILHVDGDLSDFDILATRRTEQNILTLFLVNRSTKLRSLSIVVPQCPIEGKPSMWRIDNSGYTVSPEAQTYSNGQLPLQLPPVSLTVLEVPLNPVSHP